MTMPKKDEWLFEIEGMTCDRCASGIDQTLRRLPGVVESATSFPDARTRVVAEASLDGSSLAGAIAGKGYRVVSQSRRALPVGRSAQDEEVDLAIVGGGSAAFAAAIRAADLGASAALIESGALGGTCVNVGCVPSKTLIRAAEVFHRAGHHAFAGIRVRLDQPDIAALVKQKDALVAELQQSKYRDVLAAYPSLRLIEGQATFETDGTLTVAGKPVRARKILIATGAQPWAPPIPGLDGRPYLTSTEALSLAELPRTLVVIGGSAVGLELAQLFARLGTKVTVLEAMPRLVPAEDSDVGAALATYLHHEGLEILAGTGVKRVSGRAGDYRLDLERAGSHMQLDAEQLLVATGRRPRTQGMGLEQVGIRLGDRGQVLVNDHLETTRGGVYAAGDVVGGPAFVYVAAYAGSLAAENALRGNTRAYDLTVVPRVTFTDPAVASVGLTELEARTRGVAIAVSMLPLAHVPRAIAARDTRGFIKLIADTKTNLLVGAHILAPEAGEMIQAAAMAIQFGITVDQIASMLHPYLTHAEGLKLACQTFTKDVAKLSCCAA